MKKMSAGLSLVELLVVMAIIAILTAALAFNFGEESAQKRDVERKADLRNLQAAIELYKNKNGQYPAGCNGSATWSGEAGSGIHKCTNGTGEYVVDLAPEFIPVLPTDPKLNGNNSGYVYRVNADHTTYKMMAAYTSETETMKNNKKHDFMSCDVTNSSAGVCDTLGSSGSVAADCQNGDDVFKFSYALWGGYPEETQPAHATKYEQVLESTICEMP